MLAAEVIIPQMFTAYAEDLGYLKTNGLHHFQYLCDACGQHFSAAWGRKPNSMRWYEKGDTFYCPHCNFKHDEHVVRTDRNVLIPKEARLRVKIYQKAVDFEVYCQTVQFRDVLHTFDVKYKETWRFDVATQTVTLRRYENNQKIETLEVGNPFVLQALNQSILGFFQSYSLGTANHRPELVKLLKVLRHAVREKLEKKLGHTVAPMHTSSGQWYGCFLTPLFNLAYRFTLPDAPNLPVVYREAQGDIEKYWRQHGIVTGQERWLMDVVIGHTKSQVDFLTALAKAYSLPNKPVVRRILGANPFTAGLLARAFYLCTNYDYGIRLYETLKAMQISNRHYFFNDDVYNFLREMKHAYGEAGVVQLVECAPVLDLFDSVRLYHQLNEKNRQIVQSGQIKLKELHDWMAFNHRLQTHVNVKFKVPEHIVRRLSMQTDRLKFFLPKESVELLQAGTSLHNCVASYGRDMKDNSRWVVLVADDKGKLAACLEVRGKEVVQAKIDRNKPVREDPKLHAEVLAWAKEAKLEIKTTDLKVTTEETVSLAG